MAKKRTHEEFIQLISNINDNIEIINTYTNSQTKVQCRCKKDGFMWLAYPQNLLRGKGCPVCQNKKVVKGINDIATTNSEMVKYFKNVEDSYKYTAKSGKNTSFICPKCGYEKNMSIYNLYYYGFICPKCSDGISYPNKFSRFFLSQLPVNNVRYEYNPQWAGRYLYDNYFEYDNKKYILEMDGGFHYKDIIFSKSRISLSKNIKKSDTIKDLLAKENDIILIRIDSSLSDKNYIKLNIYNSILSKIFDLSKIDWDLCDKQSKSSLLYDVCNDYKNGIHNTTTDLSIQYKLNMSTIQKYLRTGNELGLCVYTPTPHKRNMVLVKDYNNNIIHSFYGIGECCRELSKIYGDNFSTTSVIRHCNNKKPYKNFIFERRDVNEDKF
jgi:hypothetical protein